MLHIDAGLVRAAGSNLIGPEVPAALIRLPVEKVVIVLADISPWIVDSVGGRFTWVVEDRHRGNRRRAKTGSHGTTETDIEGLVAFDERIFVDQHAETLGSLAGSKLKPAECGDVILALSRRHIRSAIRHTGRA